MSTKISIIMPIRNPGMYLEEALRSIFAQTIQEFELICVDDASDDELTIQILKQYRHQYENMQVIRLDHNTGAGEARNIGFSKAVGEYTIFLDADDIFDENFLEKMYQCIRENQADVCICGYQIFYMENKKRCFGTKYIPDPDKIYGIHRESWLSDAATVAWNKLCRTEFLKERKVYFQSLACCNDVFFSCMVMVKAAKRCCVKNIPLIFYRAYTGVQISANRNPLDLYKAVMLVDEIGSQNGENIFLQKQLGALLIRNGLLEMKNCHKEAYNREFYDLLRRFFTRHIIDFQNKMLCACMKRIKEQAYERAWIYDCMDFMSQLRITAEKLKKAVCGKEPIFLWGLGYRGKIFQQFCREEGIHLHGAADIKNDEIGNRTDYGNKIFSTEDVLKSGGMIIAANEKIYQYLSNRGLNLLNLEEYYLF